MLDHKASVRKSNDISGTRNQKLETALFAFLFRLSDGNGLAYFPDLETSEAADCDVLAQLANFAGYKMPDADGLVADKRLLEQAYFLVELAHLAFHDLFYNLGRLARSGGLGAINVLFTLERFRRDVFLAHEFRVAGGNVHSDVMHQFLEIVGAGDKVALAVNFDQNADLASGMDVARDCALLGHAAGLLAGHRTALLAQQY